MRHQPPIEEPIGRRLFMKGMGAAAATLALPNALRERRAEANTLTGGGLRLARFAHLTDLHFTNREQNRYPTSHVHLKRAVADLNAQDLDFVLFTGDIFHYPQDVEEELPIVRDALKSLRHPYYMAIGNHDTEGAGLARRKRLLADGLGDRGLANGDPYYSVSPMPGLRLIVLDTTDVEGDSYHAWTGFFSDKQARWLDATLAKHRDETIFIAMHHPPITPYPFMDKLKFEAQDKTRLEAIISVHPNVQLLLAGHYHFGGMSPFGPGQLLLGPSLVEHPHPYRVVEWLQHHKGEGAVAYHWETLNLHGAEDEACSHGMPAVRSLALMSLSYLRDGAFKVTLPN